MIEEKKYKCDQCGTEAKEKIRKVVTEETGISKDVWVCSNCFYKRGRNVV